METELKKVELTGECLWQTVTAEHMQIPAEHGYTATCTYITLLVKHSPG